MQSRNTALTAFPSHLPHVAKKRCDYGVLSGKRVKGEPHRGDMARRDKETPKQQETLSKVQSGALCCLVFVCATEKYSMHIRWNNIHFSQLRAVTYLSKLSILETFIQKIQHTVPLNISRLSLHFCVQVD